MCMLYQPRVDELEIRLTPAIVSSFLAGVLTVNGDNAANQILVGADANGQFLVNGNAVNGANKGSVALIIVSGNGGDDDIIIDKSVNTLDTNGGLLRSPDSQLFGGNGNDTFRPQNGGIVGGLAGVSADGVVLGPVVGNSVAFGGEGRDTFISGPGNDSFFGGNGDDTYVWPPGTLTDIFVGGKGKDTATIIGNDGVGDAFSLQAGPDGHVQFQRTNLVNFTVNMKNVEVVNLQPSTGADVVIVGNLKGRVNKVNILVNAAEGDVTNIAKQSGTKVNILTPSEIPTGSVDLSNWKLTLPVGGVKKPTEIQPAELVAGYSNPPYFRIGDDGALTFFSPVNGVTTQNAKYARTELRELLDPSNDNNNWNPGSGTHLLSATLKVTQVPSTGKVIIGQIHGFGDGARPLVKLQYNNGNIEALVKLNPNSATDTKFSLGAVKLGDMLNYEIKADNGKLFVSVNGKTVVADVNKWNGSSVYFKAGVYPQDSEGGSSEGAAAVFYSLKKFHS